MSKLCMKCGNYEGRTPECAYCNWKDKIKLQRSGIREKMIKDMNPEEVVCYQIEIIVPEGTHSYMYSENIPADDDVRESYGSSAKIGYVSPLMRIVQHRQLIADVKEFWSQR